MTKVSQVTDGGKHTLTAARRRGAPVGGALDEFEWSEDAGHHVEAGTHSSRRPKILLVTDRVPGSDSGYSMRVDNVINGLRQAGDLHVCLIDSSTGGVSLPVGAGYETTVLRAENPTRPQKLRMALTGLAQLPYQNQHELRADLADSVGDRHWDLAWYSRARTWTAAHEVLQADRVVVDYDDLNDRLVESLVRDRTSRRGRIAGLPRNVHLTLERRRWSRLQREIAATADVVTVCSEDDREFLGFENCAVVRNGYKVPDGPPPTPDRERPTLLFVGPLSYEPNRLAAEWIAFSVLPRIRDVVPTARAVLVGYNAGASRALRHAEGVTLTGWVHDLSPYYAAASVAVTPLQSGGGTRLKVMEALARSVPLVSTTVGCSGLDLLHGEEVLVADDPDSFAEACISLIRDRRLADRLVGRGRARFHDAFTAEASSTAVAALATSLVARDV